MHKKTLLALGLLSLSGMPTASVASSCQPMFNHQDDLVATNNNCPTDSIKYVESTVAGSAKITLGSLNANNKACAYTIAVECGDEPIKMKDIAAIDFKLTVPGNKCSSTEWVAVYMFPYNGKKGGDWQNGNNEADFMETVGPNGVGGFASNWDNNKHQAPWVNANGDSLRVESGAEQHITFTSSGEEGGTYDWNTYVCDVSNTKCDASSSPVWHAYRETGPKWFDSTMMIVVDDWGGWNGSTPAPGCTVEVSDMVITKNNNQ